MKKMRAAILLSIVAGVLAVAGGSVPAQPEVQPPRSLEDQLLEDLSGDPAEEADRQSSASGDAAVEPGDTPGEGGGDLDARLRRELGAAGVSEDESPLLEVARRMHEAEGRIAQNDSGLKTQGLQRQIVSDLDRLIEQARKKCQGGKPGSKPSNGSSGGKPKQGSPGKQPGANPGMAPVQKTGAGDHPKPDSQQMRTMMQRLWNVSLPPQQRKELLQLPFDEFLPEYELLIERYFRRLSEEEDER